MSEQHLFKFQTESDYKTAKRNHLILPNVSKIVETGNTYINSKFVSKEATEAGDIIVFHENEDATKTVRYMKPEVFDIEDDYWTADAIVVVPFKHTNDGTVRAMALNYASVTTPETGSGGSVNDKIMWGNKIDVEGLKQCEGFVIFDSVEDQTIESTIAIGHSDNSSFPSDIFIGKENSTPNPYDLETAYGDNNSQEDQYLPSPYTNDEGICDSYRSSGDFAIFTDNPFSDMDGAKNTLAILKALDQDHLDETLYASELDNEQTKTITVNEEEVVLDLFPLASACARYSSELKPCVFDATKSVEENIATMPWYAPSAGELGYYAARKDRIDYALKQVGKTPSTQQTMASSTVGIAGNIENENSKFVAFDRFQGYMSYDPISTKKIIVPFCKF